MKQLSDQIILPKLCITLSFRVCKKKNDTNCTSCHTSLCIRNLPHTTAWGTLKSHRISFFGRGNNFLLGGRSWNRPWGMESRNKKKRERRKNTSKKKPLSLADESSLLPRFTCAGRPPNGKDEKWRCIYVEELDSVVVEPCTEFFENAFICFYCSLSWKRNSCFVLFFLESDLMA